MSEVLTVTCVDLFTACLQLFRERLPEKNVHATIPQGNMGYDQ